VKHWVIFICLLGSDLASAQKMLRFKEAVMPRPAVNNEIKDWIARQPHFNTLSPPEKEFYYWVNYSRANPRRFFDSVVTPISESYPELKGEFLESLRNDVATIDSLPLLVLTPGLIKVAKAHAKDITSHNVNPSHNSTNGNTFADRFRGENFQGCGAENLSFGMGEPIFLLTLLYLDIDVPNLGHRKTLLNPQYRETGIGAENFKDGSIFLVQDFACAQH
jgi:hypothetical protein